MLLCTLFEFDMHSEVACVLNVCPSIDSTGEVLCIDIVSHFETMFTKERTLEATSKHHTDRH